MLYVNNVLIFEVFGNWLDEIDMNPLGFGKIGKL